VISLVAAFLTVIYAAVEAIAYREVSVVEQATDSSYGKVTRLCHIVTKVTDELVRFH